MSSVPFDWADYLRLAEDLANKPDEASQRTSISRAYYFVYHIASARAISNGHPAGGNSHSKIWQLYQGQTTNKDARRLAALGQSMKRVREYADYHAIVHQVPDQMAQQLLDAKQFLTQLTALTANAPQP